MHLYSVSTWHSSQVFRLLTKDQRATLPTRLFHMWSYSTSNPVSTQMGDHFRAGILSRYVTSHRRQLSLLPSVGREMSTVRWCSAAGSKYNGSFHSWINVWVAGKTVWSLVNTCRSWAFWRWVSRLSPSLWGDRGTRACVCAHVRVT